MWESFLRWTRLADWLTDNSIWLTSAGAGWLGPPALEDYHSRLTQPQLLPAYWLNSDSPWWIQQIRRPRGCRERPAWGWGGGETRPGRSSSTTGGVETLATSPPQQSTECWTMAGIFNLSSNLQLITTGEVTGYNCSAVSVSSTS